MISSEGEFIPKLKSLIDANLDNPSFSVDAICTELGISRAQLHRIVKDQFDLSVTLYIRKVRLEKANELLTNTNLRISEVADRVGINNPQNFSKYFTETFAISPTEFRRLKQAPANGADVVTPETITIPDAMLPPVLAAPDVAIPPDSHSSSKRANRWVLYGFLLIVLVLGLTIFITTYVQSDARPSDDVKTSLTVLPLINMGSPDTDPICERLMEDIHTGVSLIPHLRVIARSSSDQYRNTQKSIWQIGDDLRVANILRGKVLKSGEQIQMKIELIDAKEDRLIWTKNYNVAHRDVFQLTDQITQDVAKQLNLENKPTSSEKLELARTKNTVAYNHFLQGRQLVITRVKSDVLESITRFDQALALDSTFAEAYALKALAYYVLPETDTIKPPKNKQIAEQLALTAIRIDPGNSTAYGILGTIYFDTRQWQAASNAFKIALQNNPNDAQINYWYSLLLRAIGRVDESVQYSSKAIALDPLHPVFMGGHIANCAYARKFDLARAGIESGEVLFKQSYSYQSGISRFWISQRAYDRAVTDLQKALLLNPDDNGNLPALMYCEAKRGNRSKAQAYLRGLASTTPRIDYNRAVVYAGLNQSDSSLYYLKKAADAGYIYRDMKVVTFFEPYHAHPVFKGILRQYHYPSDR
ncbi:helix-turn-helix domain-containing protein [Spirosoma sp. BT702]|uniref:Helix-turn-helix domain-containing protein n=1 Tax=Spirosoma profusum TaxID=2771354 RepID=A0A926Y1L8_9BACT|nr:helix-turn-helix domain-containing protein [Spirosoma profusum]MBD2700191.1 helix-turn-helix domain-containing protein [Spirosoma profusum]